MIRITGRYQNQTLKLDRPLDLAEGTVVEVEVHAPPGALREAWTELGLARLEEEWDNPADAVYDNWRALYGAGGR